MNESQNVKQKTPTHLLPIGFYVEALSTVKP